MIDTENFQTPPAIARYMASLLNPDEITTVLEPTPGAGNLVRALNGAGYDVLYPEDYWDVDMSQRFDAIVGNPPFSSKTFINIPAHLKDRGMAVAYNQILRWMDMTDVIVVLVPWFAVVDSDVRLRAFKRFGLISITALPRKTFNYSRIQTCILNLRRGYTGETQFIVHELIKEYDL